jgi:hypothetical protein
MILKEIAIGKRYKSRFEYLYEGFICMCELYSRLFYQFKFHTVAGKFILIVKEEEDTNKSFLGGGIYEKEIKFDFEHYKCLSIQNRRKYIIELIYVQLIIFANEYGLGTTPIEETYRRCFELSYENKWIHLDKKYTSPKKDYKFQVECEWNESHLNVYLIQLDKSGLIIKKEFWFDIVSRIGYIIYGCKGSFLDDYTFELSDKFRLNKWTIEIRSLFKE